MRQVLIETDHQYADKDLTTNMLEEHIFNMLGFDGHEYSPWSIHYKNKKEAINRRICLHMEVAFGQLNIILMVCR